MNLSYWEKETWINHIDYTIIGSGITGLNCALTLQEKYPKAKILILERGILPYGASTKNAGFACFGSVSELLDDLENHSEEEVLQLVKKRIRGLKKLRNLLGDRAIGYKNHGSYELFNTNDNELFKNCKSNISYLNNLLQPIFKQEVFQLKKDYFQFKNINPNTIFTPLEGQLNTGKMMLTLLKKTQKKGIKILNGVEVKSFEDVKSHVVLETNHFQLKTTKLFVATNAFAKQLAIPEVKPARAQVLITKPIKNLNIKGTFHLEKGYYYFRNINNRILLGGGRNLDFKTEETTKFGETELIQNKLETILKTIILPNQAFEIEHRWSGIMGVGIQKKPIVKTVSENVFIGVRLGGMGVAIGSLVGEELANLID